MFTKQHFKEIARIISQCSTQYGDRMFLFEEFCKLFEKDNPLFDKAKFAEACNI